MSTTVEATSTEQWSVEYETVPYEPICLHDVVREIAEVKAAVERVEAMLRQLLEARM